MIVKDGIKMNKKMKVIQVIPTLELGGAEIMVENLSVALSHLNNDVRVISLYSKTTPISRRLENNRIPVFYLDKKTGFDWKIFTKLYAILKMERPDVIHTHLYATSYVVPVAKLLKVKVLVHTIHSIADKEVSLARQRIYNIYYKFLKVKPVAISSMIRESFQKVYKWSGENIPLINNGIDLNKCTIKVHEFDSSKYIKIVHIGSFKEAKNHLGLIDSFSAGVPVLSADWESSKDLINDDTGYLYEMGNVEDLVDSLNQILDDPMSVLKKKEHCLKKAKEFDASNALKVLISNLKS